jgi:hypothetical protein
MLSKHCIVRISLCLILLGLVAAVPAVAGSAVIGSVAASMNATVGGQTLFPNTTLFSGDKLQVGEGVAVVALGSASRMVFGHDTVASFLRDSNEVTVLLGQGNLSVFQDVNGMPVRVKIGDVSVVPVSGFKTLGEVATLNGAVVVTAKDGALRVDNNGQVINVAKGKTITLTPWMGAPQQDGGGGKKKCCIAAIIGAGAAGVAAILAGVAISRADNATNAANSATSAAEAAGSAAVSAANAATSAANAATSTANAVGCALDYEFNPEGQPPGISPYFPVTPCTI